MAHHKTSPRYTSGSSISCGGWLIRALGLCVAAAAVAACSVAGPPAATVPRTGTAATVTVTLHIPARAAASAVRDAQYVSPSTQSASLAVAGAGMSPAPPVVANCATVCVLTVAAPVGNDTFFVNLYDARNATGNLLSGASIVAAVGADAQNQLSLVAGGVVASLSLSMGSATVTPQAPVSVPIVVTARDADGNTIVGAYQPPVTLAVTDATHATSLSTSSLSSSTAAAQLLYDGNAAFLSAVVTASAAARATARATLGVPSPKAPLRGLLDMGDISFYNQPAPQATPTFNTGDLAAYSGLFAGMVINVTWAQMQPAPGATLAQNNPIDLALAAIGTYNAAHPGATIAAKLRIWGGQTAPAWAMALDGGPIPAPSYGPTPPAGGAQTQPIGPWWQSGYIAAWETFLQMVAARYDGNPLIREVAVTSCNSETDEPFISWLNPTTVANLHAFGYTDQAQQNCLAGAVGDYAGFVQTRLDFTFNLFHLTDSLPIQQDSAFTTQVMTLCHATGKCDLNNHALNAVTVAGAADTPGAADAFVYATMCQVGPVVEFQTASPVKLAWTGALQAAANFEASSVELWPTNPYGGFTSMTPAAVAALAATLANQAPPFCTLAP